MATGRSYILVVAITIAGGSPIAMGSRKLERWPIRVPQTAFVTQMVLHRARFISQDWPSGTQAWRRDLNTSPSRRGQARMLSGACDFLLRVGGRDGTRRLNMGEMGARIKAEVALLVNRKPERMRHGLRRTFVW